MTSKIIICTVSDAPQLAPSEREQELDVCRALAVEGELCLVMVVGKGDYRVEAMRLAASFGARTLDATLTSFVFELTGTTEEIERLGTINPQPNSNWKFVPEEWVKPAIERDRQLLFGKK